MNSPALPMQDVHIYWLDPTCVTQNELLAEYETWLSEDERQRWRRYKFAKDQHQHLVTRALLRFYLSQYFPDIKPHQWLFHYNQHGKPHIANTLPTALYFNLTHTANRAVLAVTCLGDLGVDVEHIRPLDQLNGLIERCFTDPEAQDILRANNPIPERRFFRYWTLKEAYVKGRGRGLTLPLQYFEFNACDHAPQIYFHDYEPEDTRKWCFKHWSLGPQHILALALAYDKPFEVKTFYAVPLHTIKEESLAELTPTFLYGEDIL